MNDFVLTFEERLQEIDTYLDLLDALEQQVQQGPPQFGEVGPIISVTQQRILYSSVFLQLYNLIESTITQCLDGVAKAIEENGPWQPKDLSTQLRDEWIRAIARTHQTDLNYDSRLRYTLDLYEHLVQTRPVRFFKVEKGGGGNWDDKAIYDICSRLGLTWRVRGEIQSYVKQPFRNDKGALVFIRELRNDLAHGIVSFAECGEGITVSDLRDLKERTALYLRAVVDSFDASIQAFEFLLPERRPPGIGA